MTLNSVVLPAPFGPMSPVMQPALDGERRAVDREESAELHRHVVDVEQRHGHALRLAGTRHVVADAERAVDEQHVGFFERPLDAELADFGLGVGRLAALRSPAARPCATAASGAKPSPIGTTAPDGFWMMPSTARPGAR